MGICPTCGGVNGFSVTRIVDLINRDAPHPWVIACPGHAEPEPRHDGNLDDYNWGNGHAECSFASKGMVIDYTPDHAHGTALLDAKQALSLLSWLEQEKPTLEKMVGVEKDEAEV